MHLLLKHIITLPNDSYKIGKIRLSAKNCGLACWIRATFLWTAPNYEGTKPGPILLKFGWILITSNEKKYFFEILCLPLHRFGKRCRSQRDLTLKIRHRFLKRCILAPNTVSISFLVSIFENFILQNRFRKRWCIDRDINQHFGQTTKKMTPLNC